MSLSRHLLIQYSIIIYMEFTELTLVEFKQAKFSSNNFLQASEMYQRYQDLGRESYLVGLKNPEGQILAAGLIPGRPWHFGRKCFRIAGGWLMDYNADNHLYVLKAITKGAREFCRQKKAIVLTVMPKIVREVTDRQDTVPEEDHQHTELQSEFEQLGYKYLGEFEQLKWHYQLYLKGRQPDELFASFREGHRRQIRKAQKLQIRLREVDAKDAELFKSIVAETGERQKFQDPPAEYYSSMKRRFGNHARLMIAEIPADQLPEDDQATAIDGYVPTTAAMFLYDDNELSYLYGGSIRKFQKYGGAHLLQWSMIQEAIKKGYDNYNFYGVKPFADNGVYIFKQGFRGHVEELVGTFALPIGLLGKLYVSRLKPLKFRDVN